MARMDVETLKRDYSDIALVQQTKERKLQDKVLTMLEDAAVLSETATGRKRPGSGVSHVPYPHRHRTEQPG